jgi:hypothetical protein
VQLLNKPAPGSTGVDLISQVMVHLNVHGGGAGAPRLTPSTAISRPLNAPQLARHDSSMQGLEGAGAAATQSMAVGIHWHSPRDRM